MKLFYLILSTSVVLCIFYMFLIEQRCTSLFGITVGMVEAHPYCYYPAVYNFSDLVYYVSPLAITNLYLAIFINAS